MSDRLFAGLIGVSAPDGGLTAGVFFAFSTFVMKALGRLPLAVPATTGRGRGLRGTRES